VSFADVDLARDIARDRERLAAIEASELRREESLRAIELRERLGEDEYEYLREEAKRDRLAYLDDIADGLISDPDFDPSFDPFEDAA
jgi:hypothetical protein